MIFEEKNIQYIIKKIREQIKGTMFEGKVFVVGGAVRDAIMGLPIKDLDLVVEMRSGGIALANYLAAKNQCWKLDKNPVIFETYGTAKLNIYNDEVCKKYDLEFVQTRKEQYHLESRNPDTVFGTLEEDAKRRDLTINSIYYNISNDTLFDPNNGGNDIHRKIIRTPNDPDVIFFDDALRMLRCIRFSARYNWGIEKDTWFGIVKNSYRISTITKERINDELSKILVSPNASVGIMKLYHCGLLHRVLPDVYELTKVYESKDKGITLFDHTLKVLEETQPILEHRLAALFHDIGKVIGADKTIDINKFSADIAASDLKELKFSNQIIRAVELAIKNHEYFSIYADGVLPSDKKIRKFINACGDYIAITLDLMNANNFHKTYGSKKRQVLDVINQMEALNDAEKMRDVKLPINGNDLQKEFNLKKGPWIGTILNEVKEAYFENPNISKDECFEIAEKTLKKIY